MECWTISRELGFDLCQDQLDSTGGTSDGERIGQALKELSFSKAVFFGSTGDGSVPNDYIFRALDTDADALGMQSGAYSFSTSAEDEGIALSSVSGGSVSYTESFDGASLTLSALVDVGSGGGWQNGGQNFIDAAGISSTSPAWNFSVDGGTVSASGGHCVLATSDLSGKIGNISNDASADGSAGQVLQQPEPVICKALFFALPAVSFVCLCFGDACIGLCCKLSYHAPA